MHGSHAISAPGRPYPIRRKSPTQPPGPPQRMEMARLAPQLAPGPKRKSHHLPPNRQKPNRLVHIGQQERGGGSLLLRRRRLLNRRLFTKLKLIFLHKLDFLSLDHSPIVLNEVKPIALNRVP